MKSLIDFGVSSVERYRGSTTTNCTVYFFRKNGISK